MSTSHSSMVPPPLPSQMRTLAEVLAATDTHEGIEQPVVCFDLDGVLLDNRPRSLAVLHEYAELARATQPELADAIAQIELHDVEYLVGDTLRGAEITRNDVVTDITRYWRDRFFSDEFLMHDEPVGGAVEFVHSCYEAGARVVYLSARDLRGMLAGTVASLRDHGFPFGVAGVDLIMKPDLNLADETFVRAALPTLDRCGALIAYFDNDPSHCNLARSTYPDALAVLVDTQRAPYSAEPDADVPVIQDFRTM